MKHYQHLKKRNLTHADEKMLQKHATEEKQAGHYLCILHRVVPQGEWQPTH